MPATGVDDLQAALNSLLQSSAPLYCFQKEVFVWLHARIRECGSTLYVGMAKGVSFSLYIGIGAKF